MMRFNMKKKLNIDMTNHIYRISLYRRIIYTLFILMVFILGSNIPIISKQYLKHDVNVVNSIGAATMGGDYTNVNLFSLGLGPWLTSLLIINLISYRNIDKVMKQTKLQKQVKEKVATLCLCVIQGYYVLNMHIKSGEHFAEVMTISLIVLVAGSMCLIWLADQNALYGIAGPMPIVMISIIKSIFKGHHVIDDLNPTFWLAVILLMLFSIVLLVFVERSEYRLPYIDIMHISKVQKNFLAWKLNPAGSLAIMLCMSFYMTVKYIVELVLMFFTDIKLKHFTYLDLTHPIGITFFVVLLFVLNMLLSKFMLNPSKKAEEFMKSGNYFEGVLPGKPTARYLNQKANIISRSSAILISIIIGLPFYITLLIPQVFDEVFLSIQILILVYIAINVVEAIRNYLYFEGYRTFLDKYW